MKKVLAVSLIFIAVFLCTAAPMAATESGETAATSKEAQNKTVVSDLTEYKNTDMLVLHKNGDMEVKPYKNELELAANIAKAGVNEAVEIVQPDYEYKASSITNDPNSKYQWGLYNDGSAALSSYLGKYNGGKPVDVCEGLDINVIPAWKISQWGQNAQTVVAIIDTGVDTTHTDFDPDSFWVNSEEIPQNGIDDDNNGYIDDINGWNFYDNRANIAYGSDNPHGTHLAGTIVAKSNNGEGVAGVASVADVKLMVLKTLGGNNQTGKTSNIVRAIRYAKNKGAVICNLSMGTEIYDELLYKEIKESGMLFVISAGNGGENCDEVPAYPGCFDLENIISVANLKPDGTLNEQSNYGASSVEIAAPGTFILSTGEKGKYSVMSGTSMAAPFVTSVAALIHSYNPDLSVTVIRSIILETARALPALEGKVMTGMIDAGAAMDRASMPFVDITAGATYYPAVSYLFKHRFMIGTSATEFSPNDTLTRATVITILGRIAGAEEQDTDAYKDVENGSWYSGYVGWATNNGIVLGYGDGNFGPYDKVKAYQLDLIISRYAAALGREYSTGLEGEAWLTRGETAEAIYDFLMDLDLD